MASSPCPLTPEAIDDYRALMTRGAPGDFASLQRRAETADRVARRAFVDADRAAWELVQVVQWRLCRRSTLRPTDPGDVLVLDTLYRIEEQTIAPKELPKGLTSAEFCEFLAKHIREFSSEDGILVQALTSGHLADEDWKYLGYQWLSSSIDFARQIALASLPLPREQARVLYANLFDEVGRGDWAQGHFNMLRAFLAPFGVRCDDEEEILLFNVPEVLAMANAQNRMLWHPEPGWALGSLFLSERLVPNELGKIREILIRGDAKPGNMAFFDEHVLLDVEHAAEWLDVIKDVLISYEDQYAALQSAVQRGSFQKRAWDAALGGWQEWKSTGTPPHVPAPELLRETGLR